MGRYKKEEPKPLKKIITDTFDGKGFSIKTTKTDYKQVKKDAAATIGLGIGLAEVLKKMADEGTKKI